MKLALAILLAASTVAVAQNVTAPAHPPYTKNLASPVQTPKQPNYTPQMCAVQQPSPVTKAYVNYCIKTSPHSNPGCSVNDPYGMMEVVKVGMGHISRCWIARGTLVRIHAIRFPQSRAKQTSQVVV